jgi:hypothetical protein
VEAFFPITAAPENRNKHITNSLYSKTSLGVATFYGMNRTLRRPEFQTAAKAPLDEPLSLTDKKLALLPGNAVSSVRQAGVCWLRSDIASRDSTFSYPILMFHAL